MSAPYTVDQAVLDEIVRRIVEVAQPEKIILFGSAARGELGPHSDLDLLVIKGGEYHCRRLAQDIYRGLSGVGYAVDVVVAAPEVVERYRDSHPLVYKPALKEGRVIFDEPANRVATKGAALVEPGQLAPDDPRAWMRRARGNLALTKASIPDALLEDLCFNAQQAAEKAIKAVHIARSIDFPYTHDLDKLVQLLEEAGEVLPDKVREAKNLTDFAVITRYPDFEGSVTEEDYVAAVAIAEAVVAWADERVQALRGAERPAQDGS